MFTLMILIVVNIPVLHGLQTKKMTQKKTRSTLGKYLKGHVFKTTSNALDTQHCLADCWKENGRCQSFNYFPNLDVCELNEASEATDPNALIDRSDVVYLTNPMFGRERVPQMPRHNNVYHSADPCTSNPCEHGNECVKDEKVGFLCKDCHVGHRGPKCEESTDPCTSQPCLRGGTCTSTSLTTYQCNCLYPYIGEKCHDIDPNYQFTLNGFGNYPSVRFSKKFPAMTAMFRFKTTEKNTSYFFSLEPLDAGKTSRFSVWQKDNTFFVELWKNAVYNFTFPHSYPVNDNNWHVITMALHKNAELAFYLDGVMREPAKRTVGVPNSNSLYLMNGVLHLGYFKDSNGAIHLFNGSIGHFDMKQSSAYLTYSWVKLQALHNCKNRMNGFFRVKFWNRMDVFARPINCSEFAPLMELKVRCFHGNDVKQWLEQEIAPSKDLTAFTMIFQLYNYYYPTALKPFQIACYGNQGAACSLSVLIRNNMTMGVIIEKTRFDVDLIPIINKRVINMIMTWTNVDGVFRLIINGVLQSKVVNIEANGKISGQNRFIIGGFDSEYRNYKGFMENFNVWDKVLPDELLYMMSTNPGDDMGNFVAWKDFKKPSSIPSEQFKITPSNADFRNNQVGLRDFSYSFNDDDSLMYSGIGCCGHKTQITLAMWFKLKYPPGPAVLFSHTGNNEVVDFVLKVNDDGKILLIIDNESKWLANYSNGWHYIAITWSSNTGDLHYNFNGAHDHVTNFKPGFRLFMKKEYGMWYIGGVNGSVLGEVAQVNVWFHILPPASLMAMSRGVSYILSDGGIRWDEFFNKRKGHTKQVLDLELYSPDILSQKKRDEFCESMFNVCPRYQSRLGKLQNGGRTLGCFCDNELSNDMNWKNTGGEYPQGGTLKTL